MSSELQQMINSFVIVIILLIIAYLTSIIFLSGKRVTKFDRFVFIWLTWDALIHLVLEGSFVILSLTSTVEKSNGILAELCGFYLYNKMMHHLFFFSIGIN